MTNNAFVRILTVMLQYQIKKLLGEDTLGIIGKELLAIGGDQLDEQVKIWLGEKTTAIEFEKAAIHAKECFHDKIKDDELEQWMISLPLDNLPAVQTALEELPSSPDESKLEIALLESISLNWKKLPPEQINHAISVFLFCLRSALLPIEKQTLMVIGRSVLRTEEKVDRLLALVEQFNFLDSSRVANASTWQRQTFIDSKILPDPGYLPPGSWIPFYRNAIFTGREEDLRNLAKTLLINNSTTIVTQPTGTIGMGGIGKTQLAVEFCYRFGRFFDGVYWLNAHESNLETEIAACGLEMGLENLPNHLSGQVEQTIRAWQEKSMCLVVLDNLEDQSVLTTWLPRFNGLRILITSRHQNWNADFGIDLYPIGILSREESLLLLRKLAPRLKNTPDIELDKVADRLGDLPLALDLAGRYFTSRITLTPAEYLQILDDAGHALQHASLLNWVKGDNPTDYEISIAATFLLSWKRLKSNRGRYNKRVRENSQLVFIACGYLSPNTPIGRDIFLSLVESNEDADDAIFLLLEVGLLNYSLTIHPLLAEFARTLEIDNNVLSLVINKMESLSDSAGKDMNLTTINSLRPHLGALARSAEKLDMKKTYALWSNLGVFDSRQGNYASAQSAFEHAMLSAEKKFGKDSMEFARILGNIGFMLDEMGDLLGAKQSLEQALTIFNRTVSDDHHDIIVTTGGLANVLRNMGDLVGAKKLLEDVLDSKRKNLKKNDPEIATTLNDLGNLFGEQKEYSQAKQYLEEALEIYEKSFGENHYWVATVLNNLGLILKTMGDLHQAKAYLERALSIEEKTLGLEHPNVARDVSTIGSILQDSGDLIGAKVMFERALEIDEKVFGKDSSKVALRLHNLANLIAKMGDLTVALKYEERALSMWKKSLPPEHPYIQRATEKVDWINNLIRESKS